MDHKNLFDQKHIVIQPAMSIGEMREVDTDDFYYRMERYYSSLGNPRSKYTMAVGSLRPRPRQQWSRDPRPNIIRIWWTRRSWIWHGGFWPIIQCQHDSYWSPCYRCVGRHSHQRAGRWIRQWWWRWWERCGGCTRYNDTDDFDYRSHISTHVPSDDNVSELTEGVATDNLSPDDLSTNDVSTDDDPTDDAATDDVSTYDDGKDEEMPHLSYQSGFMSCLFCAKRRRLLWWQQLAMYICIQTVSDWWAMLASRKVWPHQSLKGHIEICIYIYIITYIYILNITEYTI